MLRYTVEKQLEIAEPYGEIGRKWGKFPVRLGSFHYVGRLSAQENKEPAVCSVRWAVI